MRACKTRKCRTWSSTTSTDERKKEIRYFIYVVNGTCIGHSPRVLRTKLLSGLRRMQVLLACTIGINRAWNKAFQVETYPKCTVHHIVYLVIISSLSCILLLSFSLHQSSIKFQSRDMRDYRVKIVIYEQQMHMFTAGMYVNVREWLYVRGDYTLVRCTRYVRIYVKAYIRDGKRREKDNGGGKVDNGRRNEADVIKAKQVKRNTSEREWRVIHDTRYTIHDTRYTNTRTGPIVIQIIKFICESHIRIQSPCWTD
jgi:hypothetical protein